MLLILKTLTLSTHHNFSFRFPNASYLLIKTFAFKLFFNFILCSKKKIEEQADVNNFVKRNFLEIKVKKRKRCKLFSFIIILHISSFCVRKYSFHLFFFYSRLYSYFFPFTILSLPRSLPLTSHFFPSFLFILFLFSIRILIAPNLCRIVDGRYYSDGLL